MKNAHPWFSVSMFLPMSVVGNLYCMAPLLESASVLAS